MAKRKKRQEDIFAEVLLDSNLLEVAKNLTEQIMKPVKKYFSSGGDDSELPSFGGKTFKPKATFDFEKCLGKYEITVNYMQSNSGTSVFHASEHSMTLKILNPTSREGQHANLGLEERGLEKEVLDLVEHEMGHYYLREMAGAGDCIYYTDPRGLSVYFEDPQEIVLHSKVVWNQISRRFDFGQKYLDYLEEYGDKAKANFKKTVTRIVGNAVSRLEYQVGIPGVRFPKKIQKRYVDHIMRYYVQPAVDKAMKERVASELVRIAKELVADFGSTLVVAQMRTAEKLMKGLLYVPYGVVRHKKRVQDAIEQIEEAMLSEEIRKPDWQILSTTLSNALAESSENVRVEIQEAAENKKGRTPYIDFELYNLPKNLWRVGAAVKKVNRYRGFGKKTLQEWADGWLRLYMIMNRLKKEMMVSGRSKRASREFMRQKLMSGKEAIGEFEKLRFRIEKDPMGEFNTVSGKYKLLDMAQKLPFDSFARSIEMLLDANPDEIIEKTKKAKREMPFGHRIWKDGEAILGTVNQDLDALKRRFPESEGYVIETRRIAKWQRRINELEKARKGRLAVYRKIYGKYKTPDISYHVISGHTVRMYDHGEAVGYVTFGETIGVDKLLSSSRCSEDFRKMYEKHGKANVYYVSHSHLVDRFRGRGYGKAIYEQVIKSIRGSYFLPDECAVTGSTSKAAQHVWRSLAKKYPSEGMVLYIP